MAVVLLLMLVQLPGYLSCLLCAIRAAVERAVAATLAAAGDTVSAVADCHARKFTSNFRTYLCIKSSSRNQPSTPMLHRPNHPEQPYPAVQI
uniref:Secreted protein n=1 Tax=Oryza sativa subsp. japonica TaxID=39947 RepID=Q6YS86_ORYSJ|nr:hypothetical protein [Oryza sativa Japonica Group]BAD31770.1 hypothetical protein [Oryza sativa Japonica Group]